MVCKIIKFSSWKSQELGALAKTTIPTVSTTTTAEGMSHW